MKLIYAATRDVAEASLAMLGDAVRDLPDPALDWTPVSGTNSIAVLANHSLTSLAFWIAAGAGLAPDPRRYREQTRAAAFRTRGASVEALLAELKEAAAELGVTLEQADPSVLDQPVPGTEDDNGNLRTGAACLVHGIGHLREHTGQAMLMRDLWWAASREGR
jgi:uncharacterized damage-inducible protein DinB